MHNALKVAFLLILMSGAVLSIANTYPNVYLVRISSILKELPESHIKVQKQYFSILG